MFGIRRVLYGGGIEITFNEYLYNDESFKGSIIIKAWT